MVLLAVTADTWIVTGLGFGIVLVLLFCLVYILQFFGWVMQKATAPKAPKAEKSKAPAKQDVAKANEELFVSKLTKAQKKDLVLALMAELLK